SAWPGCSSWPRSRSPASSRVCWAWWAPPGWPTGPDRWIGCDGLASVLPHAGRHLVETLAHQHGADPADGGGVQPQDPVDPGLAGATLPVPCPRSHVDPVAPPPGLVLGVLVVVLAAHLQGEDQASVAADDEHRPVLALGVVLLVGHPGP